MPSQRFWASAGSRRPQQVSAHTDGQRATPPGQNVVPETQFMHLPYFQSYFSGFETATIIIIIIQEKQIIIINSSSASLTFQHKESLVNDRSLQ